MRPRGTRFSMAARRDRFVSMIAAALGGGLTSAAAASASYPPLPVPLKIEKVPSREIYYTLGHPGVPTKDNEGHTSNAGFVVTPEGVVVFDALGTPSLGWALLQEIEKVTSKPIRYVFASHYHADHIYGLQAFKDHTRAVIIAQEKSLDYLNLNDTSDEAAGPRLAQRREALAPWVNAATRIVEPDTVFSERATIRLGGKQFLLIYAGPAHSKSDSMMLVEPDGVLFAGDIVQNGRVPFMTAEDVDTVNWLRSLKEVEQLNPGFIIPGHGKPSTDAKAAIAFTRDYIAYVSTIMQKAVEDWTEFDTAYRQADWSKYCDLPAFDANNRGNAYRIYLEEEKASFNSGKR